MIQGVLILYNHPFFSQNNQNAVSATPGIHKPHHLLGERLVQSARSAIGEVDLVVLLLEGCERPGRGDAFIVKLLRQQPLPVLVALNKWDKCLNLLALHKL